MSGYVPTIFQSVRFGFTSTEDGIVTFSSSVRSLPRESDALFWVLRCSTPFEFFDVG